VWIDRTEVALGRDVEPGRARHLGPEMLGEPGGPGILVVGIDPQIGDICRCPQEQVADVVQERGGDQGVGGADPLGGPGDLEGVLGLRDRLAHVSFPARRSITLSAIVMRVALSLPSQSTGDARPSDPTTADLAMSRLVALVESFPE